MIRPGIFPEPSGHPSLCGTVRSPLIHFDPRDCGGAASTHTPCGSATEKNSSYSDATHTQEGPSGSCRRPRFFGRNRSLHVPCSRIIPSMPTRANRNRNPTNRPTAKEKGPTVFDRQAFPSVGVVLDPNQRRHAPQRRNLFFPIRVINFILVYLHHVQRIAILPYCHLLRFFLYHFCTTIYFTSENGLLCSHRFTEIQTQFNGVSHSPIMRH